MKLKVLYRYSWTLEKWIVQRALSEDAIRARRDRKRFYSGDQWTETQQEYLNRRANALLDGIGMAQRGAAINQELRGILPDGSLLSGGVLSNQLGSYLRVSNDV